MAEDPYVYPGTNVLRNRFGLRDAGELERRERDASYARLLQLAAEPLPGRYDLAHLQAFHRHIFGDVWPWAGELRTVTIAKENTMFALPAHIAPYLSDVLAGLPRENFLRGLPPRQLAAGWRTTWPRSTPCTRSARATAAPNARSSASSPPRPATTWPGSS